LEYDVDALIGKFAEVIFAKGNYRLTLKDTEAEKAEVLSEMGFSGFRNKAAEPPKKKRKRTSILVVEEQKPDTTQLARTEQPKEQKPTDTGEINIYDYQFNSDVFQETEVPKQNNEGSRLLSDDNPKSKSDK